MAVGAEGPALDASALTHLLGHHIARAGVVATAAFNETVGIPLRLERSEFAVLMLLRANRAVTRGQVADALAVAGSSVTVLVGRLISAGWVERARSAKDRRTRLISLTAQGESLADRAYRLSLTAEEEMLKGLTGGEVLLLFELLAKLDRGRWPLVADETNTRC